MVDEVPRREVSLPSGKRAFVREGKGRDYMHAQRQMFGRNGTPEPGAFNLAMIAELTLIDGGSGPQPIVFEDVLEMPMRDVTTLTGVIFSDSANFETPPAPASQPSSSSDSPRPN